MATRIYCDHCGNILNGPYTQYEVGKAPIRQGVIMQPHPYQHGGIGSVGQVVTGQQTNQVELVVDLCKRCEPIWLARVKKLTQESDPKEKECLTFTP